MTIQQLIKSIDKKEWLFATLILLIVICISTAPYIYGYIITPDGYFYNGQHSMLGEDNPVYYSYINQAKEGAWVFRDYYSLEDQPVGTLNIFWLAIGKLAKLFDLSAISAYHICRIILLPFLIFTLYLFIAYFQEDKARRKIILFFICFSAGLGAYAARLWPDLYFYLNQNVYNWPVDLWLPESSFFIIVLNSGHYILSYSLLLLFLLFMLLAAENNKKIYSLWAGITGLFWFNFHPYYFPLVFAIIFFYYLILLIKNKNWQLFYYYIIALGLCLPSIFYHYYLIITDLVIGQRAGQNITLTPPIVYTIIGFGFLFYLSFFGLYILIRKKQLSDNRCIFIICWAGVGSAILYAPIFFQRRLFLGLQIPLVFLSCELIFYLQDKINHFINSRKVTINKYLFYPIYLSLFIILFGMSLLFFLAKDFYYLTISDKVYHLPNGFKDVTDWLKENNPEQQVILSDPFYSPLIPGMINQKIYCGHNHETIYSAEKWKFLTNYLSNAVLEQGEINFLKLNNIGFFLETDATKTKYYFYPSSKSYWQKVFQTGKFAIYKFNPS